MSLSKEESEARERLTLDAGPCEWSPEKQRAAYWNEVHGAAEWIVGHNGKWRLCANCAALPAFKQYRSRTKIKRSKT